MAIAEAGELSRSFELPANSDASLRRYTIFVLTGLAVAAVPYLWVLLYLWNSSPNLLRTAYSSGKDSNLYDLQARAMFHGHLYVPNGALNVEAFVHNGRQYTYFGIFPSLLRMPVLAFTHSLDGRLTAPSLLLAWLITALFSSLLLWRVRVLVRGAAAIGWAEAGSYGILVATILGGSVLVFLASDPYVFSEDLTWSVALTLGSIFALLGVLERPSWGRVAASGLLILAANLTRASTGYACVIGAVLVAARFALCRDDAKNRRWWPAILAAGLVPLAVGCAINWGKFGLLFGYPASDQLVFSQAGHISPFSPRFLPSTLLAYLQPGGLRLTPVFPFITLPAAAAQGVGGIHLYEIERTASLPASVPALCLLGLWGVISAFRPRPAGRSSLLRVLLVAAGIATGGVLLYGSIANRFLADFLPFLVLASALGIVDIWRRLQAGRRRARGLALAVVAVLGLFSLAANAGIASTPQVTWSADQALHYVEAQKTISDVFGIPLGANVVRGAYLPNSGASDELLVLDNCAALLIDIPHIWKYYNWLLVEPQPVLLDLTLHRTAANLGATIPLVTVDGNIASTISVQSDKSGRIRFSVANQSSRTDGRWVRWEWDRTYRITVTIAPFLHAVAVTSQQDDLLSAPISQGPLLLHAAHSLPGEPPLPLTVVDEPGSILNNSLCPSLLSDSR